MNLSPAPFGPGDEQPRVPVPVRMAGPVTDRTECNYLVMFFVLGVFLLAFMDSLS